MQLGNRKDDNMTVQQACEYLMGQDEILILCHQSPDGDTLGSGFGLYYALRDAVGEEKAWDLMESEV